MHIELKITLNWTCVSMLTSRPKHNYITQPRLPNIFFLRYAGHVLFTMQIFLPDGTEPRQRFDAISASSVKVNGCGRGRGPEFALLVTPFEHFPHQLISSNRLFLFTTTISLSPLTLSVHNHKLALSHFIHFILQLYCNLFQRRALSRACCQSSNLTASEHQVWWHACHARPRRLS